MPEVLLRTKFVTLEWLTLTTLQSVRSSEPYANAVDVLHDHEAVLTTLAEVDTSNMGLLVDLRWAVGRNDPEFESAHSKHRAQLMQAFRRVGVLVASHVGKLQVTRLVARDGAHVRVFDDREQALAWLAH